jgi:hypothetical protein
MVYPNSNLPSASQPWGKAVQKDLEKLQAAVATNEINNKARDTQLEKNYKRLDATIGEVAAVAVSAANAAAQAQSAANTANSAASAASSAASQAQAAANTANGAVTDLSNVVSGSTALNGSGIIQGTLSASKITTGTLDASSVSVTNLNANNITSGTLTGITVRTASSGTRIQLEGTQVQVYDGSSLAATIGANNGGLYLYSNGNFLALGSGGTSTNSNMTVGGTTTNNGATWLTGSVGNTTSSAANARIGTGVGQSGLMFLSTASSSRFKTDIDDINTTDYELQPERLLDLPVRVYKYKHDYLDNNDIRHDLLIPGFIAEEIAEAYPIAVDLEDGVPYSWNERMVIPGMLALIQKQHAQIQSLTDRIEALEGK